MDEEVSTVNTPRNTATATTPSPIDTAMSQDISPILKALLVDLAAELVEAISTHLDIAEDFGNFRLTCRYLKKCAGKVFAKKFFTERTTNLSQCGLDRLAKISAHKELSGNVRRLCIPGTLGADEFSMTQSHGAQIRCQLLSTAVRGFADLKELEVDPDYLLCMQSPGTSFAFSVLLQALGQPDCGVDTLRITGAIDGYTFEQQHLLAQHEFFKKLVVFSFSGHWYDGRRYHDKSTLSQILAQSNRLLTLELSGGLSRHGRSTTQVLKNTFPALKALSLQDLVVDSDDLRSFLARHQDTLLNLDIAAVLLSAQDDCIQEFLLKPDHCIVSASISDVCASEGLDYLLHFSVSDGPYEMYLTLNLDDSESIREVLKGTSIAWLEDDRLY
ncbi:Hypothetical predicted protein [Lecanosticta acicola]|uniref:F-box protein n=1 Tax=Lecanosticta acicola TaxID=111012 RepID=A0AAI8Z499_9PEZI|nr:Hypothetical predicted protein [Lecanosticta acicola]